MLTQILKVMNRVIVFLCSFLILYSCSQDDMLQVENENIDLRANGLVSELTIPKGEWESWTEIKLSNLNKLVYVPWNEAYAISNIPDNIRKDILAEDGWILLRNTIKEDKPNMNYLIFYNQFTGVLKGFYYLENPTNGNNGYWRISFDGGSQKLLYNQDGFFTYPIDVSGKNISGVNVMNVTRNPTKGFTVGWNCFQVELAYDPGQPNLTLNIDAYQQNIGSLSIKGTYQSQSSGSIISSTSPSQEGNPFAKSSITAVADSAKSWILSNISINGSKRPIMNVAANTIAAIQSGNMKALIDLGCNAIFGSFLGGVGNTATNYSLQFKTSGEVSLTGTTQNPQTTAIPPIQISISSTEKLGLWNLSQAPKIEISQFGMVDLISTSDGYAYITVSKNTKYNSILPVVNEKVSPYMSYKLTAYPTRGHLDGESYNLTSKTRANLSILTERGVYQATAFSTSFDKELFNDGKVKILAKSSMGNPSIGGRYSFIFATKTEVPKWIHNTTGQPAVYLMGYYDDKKLNMTTEDLKIDLTYSFIVNGKKKDFRSIRTYDPNYQFYTEGNTHPYGWTARMLDDWNNKNGKY